MKFLIPILIVALAVVGALAYWKFGVGANNPASKYLTQTNSANSSAAMSSPVPVTGNPNDINAAIDNAAQDEGSMVNSRDESSIVNQNNSNAAAVGNSINENSY